MLRLITFYRRWISPLLPPRCRYIPSCSAYAVEAIESYGTVRGGWLATKRICRCHPFHPGGFDPVPQKPITRTTDSCLANEQTTATCSDSSKVQEDSTLIKNATKN